MYSYPVTCWYRLNGGNDKDYFTETVLATSAEEATEKAKQLRPAIFKVIIDTPECIKLDKIKSIRQCIKDYEKEREKLTIDSWGAEGFPDNEARDRELQQKIKEKEVELDKIIFSYDNL